MSIYTLDKYSKQMRGVPETCFARNCYKIGRSNVGIEAAQVPTSVNAGTSIVSLADRDAQTRPNSLAGDALCLLSAVFYACYTVAIKRMLGRDEDTNMVLFFGYVGLINLVALAPVMVILSLTSAISLANLSAGMFGLVVAKGEKSADIHPNT